MKYVVVLTGAGVSAESGLSTFRDNDGLWHNYRVEDVATPEAWGRNMDIVLDLYNQRRKNLLEARPNEAHFALARLQGKYDVQIVTQNVDDLHERAGSKKVLHLHGELKKASSTGDPDLVYELEGWELKRGDTCEKGFQLRPHVVWFGEPVPLVEDAAELCSRADILMVIGTSLRVYPAAGLMHYARHDCPKYYIDPQATPVPMVRNLEVIKKKAGEGVTEVVGRLMREGSGG
jgi:NAD-dependent deacetylase